MSPKSANTCGTSSCQHAQSCPGSFACTDAAVYQPKAVGLFTRCLNVDTNINRGMGHYLQAQRSIRMHKMLQQISHSMWHYLQNEKKFLCLRSSDNSAMWHHLSPRVWAKVEPCHVAPSCTQDVLQGRTTREAVIVNRTCTRRVRHTSVSTCF